MLRMITVKIERLTLMFQMVIERQNLREEEDQEREPEACKLFHGASLAAVGYCFVPPLVVPPGGGRVAWVTAGGGGSTSSFQEIMCNTFYVNYSSSENFTIFFKSTVKYTLALIVNKTSAAQFL